MKWVRSQTYPGGEFVSDELIKHWRACYLIHRARGISARDAANAADDDISEFRRRWPAGPT